MCTRVRLEVIGLVIAAAVGTWSFRSVGIADGVMIRPDVEVVGATPAQLGLARWAIGRFEAEGLIAPAVDIRFHGDGSGCDGKLGHALHGTVDICTTLANMSTRWMLLHEISHVWLDQNLDADLRTRFLDLRDLPSWNVSRDPWERRGYEQGAEILAWYLGERFLSPQIPNDGPEDLVLAIELLTGRRSSTLSAFDAATERTRLTMGSGTHPAVRSGGPFRARARTGVTRSRETTPRPTRARRCS